VRKQRGVSGPPCPKVGGAETQWDFDEWVREGWYLVAITRFHGVAEQSQGSSVCGLSQPCDDEGVCQCLLPTQHVYQGVASHGAVLLVHRRGVFSRFPPSAQINS